MRVFRGLLEKEGGADLKGAREEGNDTDLEKQGEGEVRIESLFELLGEARKAICDESVCGNR